PLAEEPSNTTTLSPLIEEPSNTTTLSPLTEESSNTTTLSPLTEEPSNTTTLSPLTEEPSNTTTLSPLTEEPMPWPKGTGAASAFNRLHGNVPRNAPRRTRHWLRPTRLSQSCDPAAEEPSNTTTLSPLTEESSNTTTLSPLIEEPSNTTTLSPLTEEPSNTTWSGTGRLAQGQLGNLGDLQVPICASVRWPIRRQNLNRAAGWVNRRGVRGQGGLVHWSGDRFSDTNLPTTATGSLGPRPLSLPEL
ncbi:unnamed protein product, partial [Gadus morhua 'NCC']